MRKKKSFKLLLIEDNPGDVRLMEEALKELPYSVTIQVLRDGVEAINFFKNEEEKFNFADLILLDLNLPRKNGFEVLEFLKKSSDWKRIPVIILSTSEAEQDIVRAYDNYANCYITKPVDFDDFNNVIQTIANFWFATIRLPE